MSRCIDREALLEWIEAVDGCLADGTVEAPTLYAQMITDIKQFPTADVVEVVRCKDCAYYREETSYCLNPHCSSSYYGHRVREHHYCSHGERSEGNDS